MLKFVEFAALVLVAAGGGYLFAYFRKMTAPPVKQPPSDLYQWLFENEVKVDPKAVNDLLEIIRRGIK